MLTETRNQHLVDVVRDPVAFARGVLQHDLWRIQAAILRSVAHNRRTAVKACHASSKTFTAAEAVLWWVTRYRDGIAVTTAPTWTQVEKLLWAEIHKAAGHSRIAYPPLNKTSLQLAPDRYAIGLSTNEGVRFQGFHGRVLIVIDEAPGVQADIWEAIEGIRAGGDVRVLALGNPTITGGPFYDAFTENRSGWATFTISAFDTPNLEGLTLESLLELPEAELDVAPRPYLVTRRWVKEKYEDWGPEHPLWEARVLGRFPRQSEDALISLGWLEAAGVKQPGATEEPVKAGLDVAGPGESETVLYVRQGPNILDFQAWAQPDPRGEVVNALRPWLGKLRIINVDTVGIGYYMARHIRDWLTATASRETMPSVADVNVGEPPRNKEKYVNQKAELYWGLRQRFEAGDVTGLRDDKTVAQLAAIRYEHNARGQTLIESKEDARKRGVKSPDRAEALMLAFAESGMVSTPMTITKSSVWQPASGGSRWR